MKTINKPHDNLGGLTKIWAIPYDVFSISGKNISVSDTSNVYIIYCTPETMEFSEPKKLTDAGTNYTPSVSGFTPGDTEANLEAFEYIDARKWVILFKDGNGQYKVVGNQFRPLNHDNTLASGKDTIGRAGYTFSFSGDTLKRAKFVNFPF